MGTTWTAEAVLALAPDASSAAAGRGLGSPAKWESFGADDGAAWGYAKGSGAKPYQVAIDLSEPAFKCSCPSRKFPCKHGLGLFLLVAAGQAKAGERPDFVNEWMSKRTDRQEKAAAPKAAPDPEAQAKRAEKREKRVGAGLQECGLWLRDTVRQGLASPTVATAGHFEGIAARMVDAQAPGIARRLREMAETLHAGTGWQGRLIGQLANLHLIVEAYGRLDELPPGLRDDVLAAVGFNLKKEELPAELRVADVWDVVGQRRYQEERLGVQRSWLRGRESGRWAMTLAFSVANAPFDPMVAPGSAFRAEMAFYPGAEALRALPLDRQDAPFAYPAASSVSQALGDFADRLARCPWTELAPMNLQGVRLTGDPVHAVDEAGDAIPLVASFEPWRWLARTGGEPGSLFGEWDGHRLNPLAGFHDGRWFRL
ncbi:MAG: SWIM zinc finger family protein [Fimbriimonas sp.]